MRFLGKLSLAMILGGAPTGVPANIIDPASVYGMWEGVEVFEPRLIVMVLQKEGLLAVMTAGVPERPTQTTFRARKFSFANDGELRIEAKSEDGIWLRIQGKVDLRGTDGLLKASVWYWPDEEKEDKQPPDIFFFQRRGKGFFNRLRALAERAELEICRSREAKEQRASSGWPVSCSAPP